MEANSNKEQIVDVRSVVEAVSAEDGDAPLYQVESLCMRCGENVRARSLSLYVFLFLFVCVFLYVQVLIIVCYQ